MKTIKPKIPIETAKKRFLTRTNILDNYKGGFLTRLQSSSLEEESKAVYKIECGNEIVIFKTMFCSLDNADYIKEAKDEYELSLKAYQAASDGVAKPIDCQEVNDTELSEYAIEIIYEYCGENLLTALAKADGQTVMSVMTKVATTMSRLESHQIFHSDLKPSNIAILNDVVKILDFGVSISFDSKTQMFATKTLRGGTFQYLPPEVMESSQGHPNKIDVYSWGMTLYQLLTEKTMDSLTTVMELRQSSYPKFMKKIEKIKIKGDIDGTLRQKIVDILLKVLDADFNKRPTFAQLENMLLGPEYYKIRIAKLKESLYKVTNERDDVQTRYNELLKKYYKLKVDYAAITKIHSECGSEDKKSDKSLHNIEKPNPSSELTGSNVERLFLSLSENVEVWAKVKTAYKEIKSGNSAIDLYHGCIGNTGAMIIASALNNSSSVKYLLLGFCNINGEGIKVLLNSVMTCSKLESLSLGHADGRNAPYPTDCNNLGIEGTKAIIEVIKKLNCLVHLDISYCNVSSKEMKNVVVAVNSSESLKYIYLGNNPEIKGKRYEFKHELRIYY